MNYKEVTEAIESLKSRTIREELAQQQLEKEREALEAELLTLGGFPGREEAKAHLDEIREKIAGLNARAQAISSKIEALQGSALNLV